MDHSSWLKLAQRVGLSVKVFQDTSTTSDRLRKEKEVARDQSTTLSMPLPMSLLLALLPRKNKADLQEIAGATSLPEEATKDALIQPINSFFDSNPLQHSSPRFSGVLNRCAQRPCPQGIENTYPTASTSQNLLQRAHQPLAVNIVHFPASQLVAHRTRYRSYQPMIISLPHFILLILNTCIHNKSSNYRF